MHIYHFNNVPIILILNLRHHQFISLLRSEQATEQPILGNPHVWARLLGEGAKLTTLDQAFDDNNLDKVT